jgi:hypothetical protein
MKTLLYFFAIFFIHYYPKLDTEKMATKVAHIKFQKFLCSHTKNIILRFTALCSQTTFLKSLGKKSPKKIENGHF